MREESRGEENREQKGLEQREQESSLTLLTVICRPRTHTHKNSVTHVQSAPPAHTHTYTSNVYRKKSTSLPLYLSPINTHSHSLTLTLQLCATLTVICRPLPLNRLEEAHTHAHTCKGHTILTLSQAQNPPTFCPSVSRRILYKRADNRILTSPLRADTKSRG